VCGRIARSRLLGHGLPPGERVVLRLATPGAVQSSVTADKDGRIHAMVAVPIRFDAATYALTAIGAASLMPAPATVMVLAPPPLPVFTP